MSFFKENLWRFIPVSLSLITFVAGYMFSRDTNIGEFLSTLSFFLFLCGLALLFTRNHFNKIWLLITIPTCLILFLYKSNIEYINTMALGYAVFFLTIAAIVVYTCYRRWREKEPFSLFLFFGIVGLAFLIWLFIGLASIRLEMI